MLSSHQTLAELQQRHVGAGRLEWIGARPARRTPMHRVSEAELVTDTGLTGDHRRKPGGKRQITLIQAEHLTVVAGLCGWPALDPALLRRNLVISGINLLALRHQRFQVGAALLEGSGACHPCSRMEEVLGYGGYNAMRGHGGISARIIAGAVIHVGDAVQPST